MKSEELLKSFPEEFKKIAVIFYNLNFIEIQVITILSMFFSNRPTVKEEKDIIFNDALFDTNIFPEFENKICLLRKVITNLGRISEEKGFSFKEGEYLEICSIIKKLQGVRNKLAHNYFGFRTDGKGVGYMKRKTTKERRAEYKAGIRSGTMKQFLIDLDEELKNSDIARDSCLELFGILKDAKTLEVL